MIRGKVIERGGTLAIQDAWQADYDNPIETALIWATNVSARDYAGLVGMPASYEGDGLYRVVTGWSGGQLIAIAGRGGATPAEVLKRPIKRPRWGRVYRWGEWAR